LNKLLSELSKEKGRYNEVDYELQTNDFIRKMLMSDNSIKSYVISKYMNFFNRTLNKHLSDFNLNFGVIFDDNLNSRFIGNGYEDLDYDNLSSGEEKSLDLSVILSFDDLQQKMFNVNINLLVMDEILSGLDSTRTEIMFNKLKKISNNKAIYIVEHNFEYSDQLDSVYEVTKDEVSGSRIELVK